jgi:hypothetical protein
VRVVAFALTVTFRPGADIRFARGLSKSVKQQNTGGIRRCFVAIGLLARRACCDIVTIEISYLY